VFLRAVPAAGGGSTVEFAGLARTESSETFGAEFAELSAELSAALGAAADDGAGERGPHGAAPPGATPAGQRGPRGDVPVGTPSGTSPTAHADASAVPATAPVVPSANPAIDVPSETDERE